MGGWSGGWNHYDNTALPGPNLQSARFSHVAIALPETYDISCTYVTTTTGKSNCVVEWSIYVFS